MAAQTIKQEDFLSRKENFGGALFYKPCSLIFFLNDEGFQLVPYIFENNLESFEGINKLAGYFSISKEILIQDINQTKQRIENIISSSENQRFAEPFMPICAQTPEQRHLISPIFFAWEITNKCNYNCVYCSTNSSSMNSVEHSFSRERAFNIANQVIEAEIFQTFFSGGEPFKVDYLPDLVHFLTQEKRKVIVATNAALLPSLEKDLWKVKDARLQVKMDTLDKDRYNSIVETAGAFDEFSKGVEILSKNKMDYFFQSALTSSEIPEMEKIVEYAQENGARKIKLTNILHYGRAKRLDKKWSESQQEEILSTLSILDSRYPHFVDYTPLKIEWNKNNMLYNEQYPVTSCKAVRSYLRLLYNGSFVPCSALRNVVLGNARDDTIMDVWDSVKVNSLRKDGFKCPLRERFRLELENCRR